MQQDKYALTLHPILSLEKENKGGSTSVVERWLSKLQALGSVPSLVCSMEAGLQQLPGLWLWEGWEVLVTGC